MLLRLFVLLAALVVALVATTTSSTPDDLDRRMRMLAFLSCHDYQMKVGFYAGNESECSHWLR